MKATEQCFPVVFVLYKVTVLFQSVVEVLRCDNSNESYQVVLASGVVQYVIQGSPIAFEGVAEILMNHNSNKSYRAEHF